MANIFHNLTYQKAQEKLRRLRNAALDANRAFIAGDHWQGGLGWVGPMPKDPAQAALVGAEIARAFVSKNAIREVVRRHVAGVLGREPNWGLTVSRSLAENERPTQDEQARIDEAGAALTTWWDEREILTQFQEAAETTLLAGHAPLRLFVPPDRLEVSEDRPEDGPQVPRAADLAGALDNIWLDNPDPTTATIELDRRSMQRIGMYSYKEDQYSFIELCYVDGENTVLRTVRPGARPGEQVDVGIQHPLGGRMLHFDIRRPALITEQVRQLQKLINLALTMLSRNVVQAGFLERIVLNGQMPGYYEDDPENPGKERFVPMSFKLGAATTNFIMGKETRDAEGNITGFTNPSVVYRDPVKPDTFTATMAAAYRAILEECNQLHTLIAGDATASGVSRQQAMADYIADLIITASRINAVGRALIEAVLTFAAVLAGDPTRYAGLRATFTCRINPGPLTPDEVRVIIERVKEKLLSKESGLERMGEEDVDAELARIAAEAAQLAPAEQVNLERSRLALERDRQPLAAQAAQQRLLAASQGQPPPAGQGGEE